MRHITGATDCPSPLYTRNGKRPPTIQRTCDDTPAGPHKDPLTASSGRPSDERVTCGVLGRKVGTETSSRKESSEQERTTDKTLLCYLAGHREKGSAHTTMIALMFLVKKYCAC